MSVAWAIRSSPYDHQGNVKISSGSIADCGLSPLGGAARDDPISLSSYSLLSISATIGTGTQCPKNRGSNGHQPRGDFKEPNAGP